MIFFFMLYYKIINELLHTQRPSLLSFREQIYLGLQIMQYIFLSQRGTHMVIQ